MCRNIKTLFNFDPPVTTEEVQAASLQFVRKITGFNKPSKANEAAFQSAIDDIAAISNRLRDDRAAQEPRRRGRQSTRPRGGKIRHLNSDGQISGCSVSFPLKIAIAQSKKRPLFSFLRSWYERNKRISDL